MSIDRKCTVERKTPSALVVDVVVVVIAVVSLNTHTQRFVVKKLLQVSPRSLQGPREARALMLRKKLAEI